MYSAITVYVIREVLFHLIISMEIFYCNLNDHGYDAGLMREIVLNQNSYGNVIYGLILISLVG